MSFDRVADRTPIGHGRRRGWIRIGVPLGGVILVIVTILAIALYSDRANRAGVVSLSDDLLASVQRRITTQVASYLDPAVRATRLVRDAVEWGGFSDRST